MTEEEFNKLTKEEVRVMSHEDFLKHLIRFSEERYIWYKNQLELVFKDKQNWPPTDEFTIWYKDFLKDWKSINEKSLKENRLEMEYLRQGLNPIFCYPEYKRQLLQSKQI